MVLALPTRKGNGLTTTKDTTNARQVPLRSLGAVAPPHLVADLRALLELPQQARDRLWSVLSPCMSAAAPAALSREMEAFERTFELPANLLPRILRAYRSLVSAGALRSTSVEAIVADLASVTESDEPGRIVALGYAAAVALVRREAMREALREHGAVLDGIDWRVNHVGASSRGDGLKFGFGALTLRYEDRGRQERLTVQATPEMLLQLEAACRAMIGGLPRRRRARRPNRRRSSRSRDRERVAASSRRSSSALEALTLSSNRSGRSSGNANTSNAVVRQSVKRLAEVSGLIRALHRFGRDRRRQHVPMGLVLA